MMKTTSYNKIHLTFFLAGDEPMGTVPFSTQDAGEGKKNDNSEHFYWSFRFNEQT